MIFDKQQAINFVEANLYGKIIYPGAVPQEVVTLLEARAKMNSAIVTEQDMYTGEINWSDGIF